jgi:predicted Rossmann-fold nucleotide-binding protein
MALIKIGIVGSRTYTNRILVENAVNECIKKYGNDICIVSGGAIGADRLGRIVALDKGLKYIEYNPAHEAWNEYSGMPKEWYGKPYHVKNYFERNTFIAEECQLLLAFIPAGHISNGTNDTISKAEKLNKPVIIIN